MDDSGTITFKNQNEELDHSEDETSVIDVNDNLINENSDENQKYENVDEQAAANSHMHCRQDVPDELALEPDDDDEPENADEEQLGVPPVEVTRKENPSVKDIRKKTGPEPKQTSKKQKAKVPWTREQKEKIHKYLQKFINIQKVPGKEDCKRLIDENESLFQGRDWKSIKYYIYNKIQKLKKN